MAGDEGSLVPAFLRTLGPISPLTVHTSFLCGYIRCVNQAAVDCTWNEIIRGLVAFVFTRDFIRWKCPRSLLPILLLSFLFSLRRIAL